jgi:arylsulfatase A-like enzyme
MSLDNVLFIMCDQLRADYLSCYGATSLQTPTIDALARRGVRFSQAFVQSGVCGPSRMSLYTGRYPSSHGASWNFIPMPMSEMTIADYLAAQGRHFHLTGKTHFEPSQEARALGTRAAQPSPLMSRLMQGGFEVVCRHEGDLPSGKEDYLRYLQAQGYEAEDPWLEIANSGRHPDGSLANGWFMRNAGLAANVQECHSETAYVSGEAIRFIRRNQDIPWALHLSYIKPHWPYMAPAPYHSMYRQAGLPPIRRRRSAEVNEHPVMRAYRTHDECVSFSNEETVRHVQPTYMGLIKQIDDHLAQVLETLEQTGQSDRTLIIFMSDHGEFLGDYGLGEKELFHDVVQRVPLIVVDPSSCADATRGTTESRFAEGVDIVPTVLEALGLRSYSHRMEGRSLLPLLRSTEPIEWRDCVFSELDYATRRARRVLGLSQDADCRAWMVRSAQWKLVLWSGFRAQLFNLIDDPDEFFDLGDDPRYEAQRAVLSARLLQHSLGLKSRTEIDNDRIEAMTDNLPPGIYIGQW